MGRMGIVRALTTAFSEVDFRDFRDALADAESLDDLGPRAASLATLLPGVIDRDVHVHLHDINAAFMVGKDFHGWDGFLEFWRNWLEPWESYAVEFTRWEEVDDTIVYRLAIEAQGRGSGITVRDAITQAWTVPENRVTRLGMYARRRTALADLARD
jgi:hypothetical protein